MDFDPSRSKMYSPVSIDDELNQQILDVTTRFEPSPDIKNIMVTGGNGFIGTWVVRALAVCYSDCYNLVSIDKLFDGASMTNTQMLEGLPNFKFVQGDITCPEDVTACIRENQIDTIIHLAAQSNVDASLKSPFDFVLSTIRGTQVILESAKVCGVTKLIQMSSFEAYGATKSAPSGYQENEPLSPLNPYGAGKAAAEMLVTAVGHSSPLQTMIVRANNIFGAYQFPDKVIPKFIMLLRQGKKLTFHGEGLEKKRYLYAGDAANAMNVILHKGSGGDIFNLGSREEINNRDLAALLVDMVAPTGSDSLSGDGSNLDDWITKMPGRPFADSGTGLDCTKLKSLGWAQNVSFSDGIRQTVEWYAAHGDTWWGDIHGIFA